jgi:hypothetical protein
MIYIGWSDSFANHSCVRFVFKLTSSKYSTYSKIKNTHPIILKRSHSKKFKHIIPSTSLHSRQFVQVHLLLISKNTLIYTAFSHSTCKTLIHSLQILLKYYQICFFLTHLCWFKHATTFNRLRLLQHMMHLL